MLRANRREFGISSGCARALPGWVALLAGAALAGCGGGAASGPVPMNARARAAIGDSVMAFVASWREAVISLDTARLASFYSADSSFRWIEDGRIRYSTGAELLAAWRGTVPGVRSMDLLLDQTQVIPLAPGVAAVTTTFTQKVVDTVGQQGGFAGATSLVAVHTADGWRFLVGHTSAAGGSGSRP